MRINVVKGLRLAMQITESWTVDLPANVHRILDQRTNPAWPTIWFVPYPSGIGAFRNVYEVMNNLGANHSAFCHGHVGNDLITLASMLRIPVYVHNVTEKKIFRPRGLDGVRDQRATGCGLPSVCHFWVAVWERLG